MTLLEQIQQHRAASAILEPSPTAQEHLFAAMSHYATGYLSQLDNAPAYLQNSPDTAQLKSLEIEANGATPEALFELLSDVLLSSGIDPTSGRFFGYIPGGAPIYAAVGDFLAAITNRYAGIYHASPGAVSLENALLQWLMEVLGYPSTAAGNLSSGGSIANLTAIMTARDSHNIRPPDIPRTVVYLTEHVHHCIDKALHVLGLRDCIQQTIPVDAGYRMRPDALEQQIIADKAAGLIPWLVVGSAGTTNSGAVDPLQALGDIAQQQQLWFHVDGAYGGLFRLCPEVRDILQGIAASDSIVVDPHKTLFLPYGTGAVLVKDARKQFAAFNADADYMEFIHDNDELSPADLSPELTKHFRGLRLWFTLKIAGEQVFRAALSEKILLARYFYEQMQTMPGFVTGGYPDLSVVTYRYQPQRGDANTFNQQLMEALLSEGKVHISSTRLDGKLVLRAAIMSFRTHQEQVDVLLDRLRYHAAKLAAQ